MKELNKFFEVYSEDDEFFEMHSRSLEIIHHSIDLRAEHHKTLPKQNPFLGYIFMVIYILGITGNHLSAKIAFYRNPNLTNYDGLLFLGFVVTPTYFTVSFVNK